MATPPSAWKAKLHVSNVARFLSLPRIVRNLLHVASGNAVSVGLNIVTLAVLARMLGPALLGILAMVEAYGRVIDQALRLETWQAVIRHGATAIERGDHAGVLRLVKLGFLTDIVGCLVATTVALACVPLAAWLLGWSALAELMAYAYCAVLLFSFSSTPTGVLRLFDYFAQVAWLPPLLAFGRLASILAIAWFDGGIWPVLIATILFRIAEHLALTVAAWLALRRRHYGGAWRAPLKGTLAKFPGIVGFTLAANGSVLVRKSTQEVDVLVVGAYAGPIGAGIYHIARKIAFAASKAGAMLQQVTLPDLARLWASTQFDRFTLLVGRMEAITLGFAIVVIATLILAGDWIILMVGGSEFEDAYVPLLVHTIAVLLFLAGTALRSGIMAAGRQIEMLGIVIVSAAVYYATLFVAVPRIGIVGGSLAHVAFSCVWLPGSYLLFKRAVAEARTSPLKEAQEAPNTPPGPAHADRRHHC